MLLVTGICGFIGSHLAEKLKEKGIDFIGYDNLSNPFWVKPIDRLIVGDILDKNLLDSIFKNFGIDSVVHLAALINARDSSKSPAKYFDVNVNGTFNVLSTSSRNRIRKIVLASSFAVYDDTKKPVSEKSRKCPKNTYGITKLMNEMSVNRYAYSYGLDFTVLRFSNVGGGVIGRRDLISKCFRQDKIIVNGNDYDTKDGTAIRDYVHVDDVVDAIIMSLENEKMKYETYNVCSGISTSVAEVIAEVSKYKKIEQELYEKCPYDIEVSIGDNSKIKKLGWSPKKSYIDIVKDSNEFYKIFKKNKER